MNDELPLQSVFGSICFWSFTFFMSQVRAIGVWINLYFHAYRLDLVSSFINVIFIDLYNSYYSIERFYIICNV
jgi:hypothetical protein